MLTEMERETKMRVYETLSNLKYCYKKDGQLMILLDLRCMVYNMWQFKFISNEVYNELEKRIIKTREEVENDTWLPY